jgi:hypothetical protein
MEAFSTKTIGNFTAKCYYDENTENPRKEWDHLAVLATWNTKYAGLGDCTMNETDLNTDTAYALKLYVYDHSGLTINTTGFSCGWDSSMIGVAFIEKTKFHDEFGQDATEERAFEVIRAEVKELDMYLRGEVYGYIITDEDGIEVSSCWGLFGYEYLEEEVNNSLAFYNKEREVNCGVQLELALA